MCNHERRACVCNHRLFPQPVQWLPMCWWRDEDPPAAARALWPRVTSPGRAGSASSARARQGRPPHAPLHGTTALSCCLTLHSLPHRRRNKRRKGHGDPNKWRPAVSRPVACPQRTGVRQLVPSCVRTPHSVLLPPFAKVKDEIPTGEAEQSSGPACRVQHCLRPARSPNSA